MRRAFTLLEILVVIGIMGLMVTVGVVNFRAGKGPARVKGATRDVFAAIRHARSTALVTGQPAIITYSTEEVDGEVMAKIEVTSAKLFDTAFDRSKAQTLTGGPLLDQKRELVHIARADDAKTATTKTTTKTTGKTTGRGGASAAASAAAAEEPEAETATGGETLEDVLFAPMDESIVKGVRIKVVKADEAEAEGQPQGLSQTRRSSGISVFSNVDYLLGKFKAAQSAAKAKETAAKDATATGGGDAKATVAAAGKATGATDERQEPVSVVWETNGRVDPHQVWVYLDGKRPEDGLSIKIDRFGAAKVISGDGKEDDD